MDDNSKFSFKNTVVPVITLTVICCVITALLALTHAVTAEPTAKNNEIKADKMRREIFTDATEFSQQDDYYTAFDGDKTLGYIFETSAKGYGGDISVMTGIDTDGAVVGVQILTHSETPGLGANCTQDSFKDQFIQPYFDGNYNVIKGESESINGNIDAITGATISSKAVTSAVNKALESYEDIIKRGE